MPADDQSAMEKAQESAGQAAQAVSDGFHAAGQKASEAADAVGDYFQSSKDSAAEKAEGAKEAAAETADSVKESASQAASSAQQRSSALEMPSPTQNPGQVADSARDRDAAEQAERHAEKKLEEIFGGEAGEKVPATTEQVRPALGA